MKIIIGSKSKPKVSAIEQLVKEKFSGLQVKIVTLDVDSNVSPTPFSIDECIKGARHRINEAKKIEKDGRYYIGVESGIIKTDEFFFLGAWAVVRDEKNNKEGVGSSAMVPMPKESFLKLSPDVRISETLNFDNYGKELIEQKKILGVGGVITNGLIKRHDQVLLALRVAFSVLK